MKLSQSIIQPKTPKGAGWVEGPETNNMGTPAKYWFYPSESFSVMSAVESLENNVDGELSPHYHVSISKNRGRCTRNESKFIMKAFDMRDSLEDNHVPNGFVRNFFLPVAEKYIGVECPCIEEETEVRENKGDFIWRGINK